MSQVKTLVVSLFFYFFGLIYPASDAWAKPTKKIDPKGAVDRLFSERAKKVNEMNRDLKNASALTPEEERELNSKLVPLTLTPEEIKREDAETAKDPEEQIEDGEDEQNAGVALDEEDSPSKGAVAGKTNPESSVKASATKTAPMQVPSSSGGGTAVPGQADPNMIVYPGKKKP